MNTSIYIEQLKPLTKTGSLYAVAKLMRVSEQAVHGYAKGQRYFDEYACLRVSELLNVPIERVLADVALERETDPAKREVWSDLLRKFAAAVMIGSGISLALGVSLHGGQASKFTAGNDSKELTRYKLHAHLIGEKWLVGM